MADRGLKKRSVVIAGHSTSVALEPEFWAVLERVAAARALTVPRLLAELDQNRGVCSLASAARVAALAFALEQNSTSLSVKL